MLNERLAIAVKTIWVSWLCVDDFTIDVHGVIILEWRVTSEHFIQQDSECPPVNGLSMALVEQNLWRYIFWSSANGVGSLSDNLGETEVNHLQVAIGANHDVLWLQVSVYDL